MYEYIKGMLVYVGPHYVVVENGGIGYQLQVANPFRFSGSLKKEITFYVYQAVREDAITLFGFKDYTEKQLYLKLISVSGIGPKSGLSILASDDHLGLIQAIESDNVSYLTKFPGVGKKTASQIILDLKGKIGDLLPDTYWMENNMESGTGSGPTAILEEAIEALSGLGYSDREVKKIVPVLEKEDFKTTEEVLRMAFKLLLKG